MRGLRLLTTLLLTIALQVPLFAQKSTDPRPLEGPLPDLPQYASIQDALAAGGDWSLTSSAVSVGRAELVRLSGAEQQAAVRRFGLDNPFDIPETAFRLERADNGTVRWMTGNLGKTSDYAPTLPAYFTTAIAVNNLQTVGTALGFLGEQRVVLRLNEPAEELAAVSVNVDRLGYRHVRFEQVYKGVPVWGRDLYVHSRPDGEFYLVNGAYEPTPGNLRINPSSWIGDEQAFGDVVDDLKKEKRWAPIPEKTMLRLDMEMPQVRIVLYPMPDRTLRPAYEVTLHANLLEHYLYIVDALDGSILNRIARHCSFRADDHTPVVQISSFQETASSSASGAGSFAGGAGNDIFGIQRSFRVYHHDNGTYYAIWDLPNLNAGASQFPDQPSGGAMTLSADNNDLTQQTQLYHNLSNNNTWNDPIMVSAHYHTKLVYDYYSSTFGRKAIDNNDQSMISIVHVTSDGAAMDNAFWNGRFMAWGDGVQFKPWAGALDIAGHEMTHGVVEHTAGLIYQFQSGALNESFADVFGVFVDPEDYLLAEDIVNPGLGPGIRDLANPDNPQLQYPQPAHMNTYREMSADQDNGGVHINSGIPNRAAYLIIESVGREKAQQIYYRALTNYLTRNSQFVDCRNAVEQAAKDLYGDTEAAAVRAAFDAVGIGGGAPSDGSQNDVDPVNGGTQMIAVVFQNGRIGFLDVSTGESFVFEHTAAVARISGGGQDVAQLSTPRDGKTIWFVNPDNQLSYIDVATGEVFIFEQLGLQQLGDIWNASISPSGDYAALVSSYQNDPNLYIFDGQNIGVLALKPESTQEGIEEETIKYPDVVTWSPNENVPRMAFDAYNEVPLFGGSVIGFWSMYEVDFNAERIYDLVPAQPQGINVGNVVYSSTDPDIVAFNVFNDQGVYDIYLANFQAGAMVGLNLPSYTVGGNALTDGQRPTFSPDDNYLCFTSPGLGVLLFFDFNAQELSFVQMPAPVYNPVWFTLGGTIGAVGGGQAAPMRLKEPLPNPFNGTTVIRFALQRPAEITLQVTDALGRPVRSLIEGRREAGEQSIRFDASDLPSGTYHVRLKGEGRVETRILHHVK